MMLLKMSISSSILIVMVIILRAVAINKLPKKTFVLLWNIVQLRLLIPFDLPIHYGIASPVAKMVDSSVSPYNAANSQAIMETPKELIADTVNTSFNSITWTMAVWAAGMAALLVIFGILYWREYQKIQAALPVSKETEHYFRSVTTIPNRVTLLVSDRIFTPLTFGVLSPKIIFPKILQLSDDTEIKYVLTHEVIHIKRFDNLWKIVTLIAVSVHWFNPFVWMMYILFHRDVELSCDEKVIALWGEATKKEYAMALMNLAEKQYQWASISNGFGKNAIRERIMAIMKFKKASHLSIGCAALLLAGAITVFAQNDSKAIGNDIAMVSELHGADDKKNSFEKERAVEDEYLQHGITTVDGAYYYQGRRVRIFMDLRENKSFENFSFDSEGIIDVWLVRAENNSIEKIECLTEKEANEVLSDFEDYNPDGQTKEHNAGVISRMTIEELPNEVREAISSCDDEKWYVVVGTEYQYVYFNALPANYAFQPEINVESHNGTVSIFDMGTSSGNYVLLEVDRNVSLTILYNHSQVTYIELSV